MKANQGRTRAVCIAALVLALAAAPAWGNVGTPLMWASFLHLTIGNAVLGIVEGLILARLFRLRKWWAVGIMVAANYATMAFGLGVVYDLYVWVAGVIGGGRERLFVAPAALRITWGLVVAATVLLEWPAVMLVMRRSGRPWRDAARRGLLGSAVVHALSYSCLIPFYGVVTVTTLHSSAVGEPTAAFAAGRASAWVYYIDDDASEVRRIRVDGSSPEPVRALDATEREPRLFPSPRAGGGWVIWVSDYGTQNGHWVVDGGPTGRVGTYDDGAPPGSSSSTAGTWHVVDLQEKPRLEARVGFFAVEGLRVSPVNGEGETLWLAWDTPFGGWRSSFVTLMPGDLVVYQVGRWILILDVPARRWGLLTRGRNPVVVLDE